MARRPDADKTPSELDIYAEQLGPRIDKALPLGVHFVLVLFRPSGAKVYARIYASGATQDQISALAGALHHMAPADA